MEKMIYYIILGGSLLLPYIGCNTVEPPEEGEQPGRRDYVWTVDTLNCPNDPLGKMWGSSPDDIWRTSDGYWEKSISHFNGENWVSYGISGIIAPFAIYGFANNNVFIGSAGMGKIWRFDGTNWNEFAQLTKDGNSEIIFENIWGKSPNDFYAVGGYGDDNGSFNNSVIAHFHNNNWNMFNTDDIMGIVEHLYTNKSDNKIYLQLIRIGNTESLDSTIIYEYTNGTYIKLYSNIWTKGLQADISLINDEVYFILGSQIAIRVSDKFQTLLNVDNPNFYQRIWGRNPKDIFLLMTDGLAHYNGSDV
jgi:hypothetical protein